MSLTEFLLARIAEDEVFALRMDGPPLLRHIVWAGAAVTVADRVLAECQAKRRIVGLRDSWPQQSGRDEDSDPILRTMTTVYADHPDYDQGWKL